MTDPNRLPDPTRIIPGNVPPSELDAEGYVLSWAVMMEGNIDRVVATGLREEHFYADANRRIWSSMVRLSVESGRHVDIVSLAADLRSLGRLDQIGGTPYLAQLIDSTPIEAKDGVLEQHCRSIIAAWTARAVIAVCQTTGARLYHPQGATHASLIAEHEAQIWELAHQDRETVYELAGAIAASALSELVEALRNGGQIGVTTGFEDLDKKSGGYQKGHFGVVAGRAGMGKSSMLTSSLIRSTRLPQDGSLPFAAYLHSLEMPKEEVALRLVCIEAVVEYQKMRMNLLTNRDWEKLFHAASTLAKQPLLIGDKPGLTVQEFRSGIRKVKREIEQGRIRAKGIGIAAVDYLQLMSGDKSQSRELEVSSVTRNLKSLAKSEELCVLALSQVNRAPEKKAGDKRPTLADLRECLAGDQWVYDAQTGRRVMIRDLAAGATVASLDADWKIRPATVAAAWSTGEKQIFKLTTGTGRAIRATGTHPMRTLHGWKALSELAVGEKIAVPRRVPEPINPGQRFTDDELSFLGYMISDGTYIRNRSVGYVKGDPAPVDEVRRIAFERFGVIAKNHRCQGPSQQIELTESREGHMGPGKNPVINWFRELGIHDQLGPKKVIPTGVLEMDNRSLAIFLAALWVGDGSVVKKKKSGWVLKFTSTSFALLDQVMWILTRLGIVATHGPAEWNSKSKVPIATIAIHDQLMIRRFAQLAPMIGVKGKKLTRAATEPMTRERPGLDRLPLDVNEMIRADKIRQGHTYKSLGWVLQGKHISRPHLSRVAATLGNQELLNLATSDVLWDLVDSVEPDGIEEAFDVSVPGPGNFVAQNMCVHNSGAIENDADFVWFVYRDKYYNKESNDDAEIIIAKQRGGATGTVMLGFDGPTISFRPLPHAYEEYNPASSGMPGEDYWDGTGDKS